MTLPSSESAPQVTAEDRVEELVRDWEFHNALTEELPLSAEVDLYRRIKVAVTAAKREGAIEAQELLRDVWDHYHSDEVMGVLMFAALRGMTGGPAIRAKYQKIEERYLALRSKGGAK